jgi:cell division protease FtsH
VGPVTLAPRENPFLAGAAMGMPGPQPYSEATAQLVDAEVERILQECYETALQLLRQHRSSLDALARALLERETLDEKEIRRVTGIVPAPRADQADLPMAAAAYTGAMTG